MPQMEGHLIYGIHLSDRVHFAPGVQSLLTEYGCYIRTRIGLHDVGDNICGPGGVILLEMFGDQAKCQELFVKLTQVPGVEMRQMAFDHV